MGVYQSSCDSLECIADSDFTSESIIWRTSQAESYRIAVSVLPSGPPLGTFSLTVVSAGESCPSQPGSSTLLPGSCSVFASSPPVPSPTEPPRKTRPPELPPTTESPTRKTISSKQSMKSMKIRSTKRSKSKGRSTYSSKSLRGSMKIKSKRRSKYNDKSMMKLKRKSKKVQTEEEKTPYPSPRPSAA